MDSIGASAGVVAALNAGGTAGQIAASVLSSTERQQATDVSILFNSIGLGQNFNGFA